MSLPGKENPRNTSRPRLGLVAAHDSSGGAARAAFRVFEALHEHESERLDTYFRAIHSTTGHPKVLAGKPVRNRREYAEYFLRTRFRKHFPRPPFTSPNKLLHSQALYHSGLARELNDGDWDILLLNWLGNATLSIPEIGRLSPATVWLLHDMWMFSGAEHYTDTDRAASSYSRASRPKTESGPDIDRETFRRKRRHWKTPQHVICPSNWMAQQVRRSALTQHWPTHVIPYPINLDKWAERDRNTARQRFNLPTEAIVVLSGIAGGSGPSHKGGDLFFEALGHLDARIRETGHGRPVIAAFFGEARPDEAFGNITLRFLGKLDDQGVADAYAAANVMVVPSRQDNFPSTGTEPQVGARPVVAFGTAGLTDIVEDGVTGRLAAPFDSASLAEAIEWVVIDPDRERALGQAARDRAVRLWEPRKIAAQYADVLIAAYEEQRKTRG